MLFPNSFNSYIGDLQWLLTIQWLSWFCSPWKIEKGAITWCCYRFTLLSSTTKWCQQTNPGTRTPTQYDGVVRDTCKMSRKHTHSKTNKTKTMCILFAIFVIPWITKKQKNIWQESQSHSISSMLSNSSDTEKLTIGYNGQCWGFALLFSFTFFLFHQSFAFSRRWTFRHGNGWQFAARCCKALYI